MPIKFPGELGVGHKRAVAAPGDRPFALAEPCVIEDTMQGTPGDVEDRQGYAMISYDELCS